MSPFGQLTSGHLPSSPKSTGESTRRYRTTIFSPEYKIVNTIQPHKKLRHTRIRLQEHGTLPPNNYYLTGSEISSYLHAIKEAKIQFLTTSTSEQHAL